MRHLRPLQNAHHSAAISACARKVAASCLAWLLVVLSQIHFSPTTLAQSLWETSPYRVRVWIDSEERAPDSSLNRHLTARLDELIGAAWELEVEAMPEAIAPLLATHPEGLSDTLIEATAPAVLRLDKLFVVQLRQRDLRWHVSAREFDVHTRRWGTAKETHTAQATLIPSIVAQAIVESFSPIVKLGNVRDEQLAVQLKAAALLKDGPSPARIQMADILQPIERFNNRQGLPRQIRDVKWTYLVVSETDAMQPVCKIYSGLHNPLGGRTSIRTERLALVVKPSHGQTRLMLTTKDTTPQPIVGCAVLRQQLGSKETTLLGLSDWRGSLEVAVDDAPLTMLFFKNGNQLLARLPIVAGLHEQVIVPLHENDARLEAEGFLLGVEENLVDVIARRTMLAASTRALIEASDWTEAERLISELRLLETPTSLGQMVQQREGRIQAENKRVQQRIDGLFNKTRKLLLKHRDPQLAARLSTKLASKRAGE